MGKKEKKADTSALVYIKDPEYAWIPATMDKEEGGKAYVTVPQYKDEQAIASDGGRAAKSTVEQVVKLSDYPHKVLPLQNVDTNGNLLEFSDMVQLPYLHEVRSFFWSRKVPTDDRSAAYTRLTSHLLRSLARFPSTVTFRLCNSRLLFCTT